MSGAIRVSGCFPGSSKNSLFSVGTFRKSRNSDPFQTDFGRVIRSSLKWTLISSFSLVSKLVHHSLWFTLKPTKASSRYLKLCNCKYMQGESIFPVLELHSTKHFNGLRHS